MRGSDVMAGLILLGAALPLQAAFAQPAPSAASSPGITVAEFDNPLGPGALGSGFGGGVMLDAAGTTALIGGPAELNSCAGAVYVYEQVNGEWMTSPAWEFTNPDGTTYTCTFGDMAFSADGSTAVFGAPFYVPDATSNVSLVYIYAQTDHVWSQAPVAVLGNPRPGGNDNDCFGCGPIAISADGSTLLLGDTGATIDGLSSAGAAYLYKRVDGTWDTTPVATFLDPEMKALDQFAISVALSADGNEVLIGDANGYGTSGGPGAGYLYVAQPGGIWPTDPKPAVVLQAPDAQKFDYFGSEVAFAANGTDAFIENDPIITGNEPPGSYPLPGVYLFQQVDGEWPVTPIRKFVLPKGYEDFGAIGPGFAVSGDGNTLMITALSPSLAKQGPHCCDVVLVYTKTNGTWSQNPVRVLEEPNESTSPYNNAFYVGGGLGGLSYDGSVAIAGDTQPPNLTPPPPNQVPVYTGPGVAFAFKTTNHWKQVSPPPPPAKSGGGGAFGWWTLAAFLFLVAGRGYIGCRLT